MTPYKLGKSDARGNVTKIVHTKRQQVEMCYSTLSPKITTNYLQFTISFL